MKFLLVGILLFSNIAFASDAEKVRNFVEAQYADKDSTLYKKLNDLMEVNKIPAESTFALSGADMLFAGNNQNLGECDGKVCKTFERAFFSQFSDLRLDLSQGKISKLYAWPFLINMSVMRIWQSDYNGDNLSLVSESITLENITFLY